MSDKARIKSLPTEYRGTTYRSRTEARWAFFFTENHIPFVYEMEGYDLDGLWYLPDFWFPVAKSWFEVKPCAPTQQELEKARRLAKGTGRLVFIAPGNPKAEIGLYVISPTGRMKTDWRVTYAHEDGVGFICDNCWNYEMKVRIRETDAEPGMYGIGTDDELDAAGNHHFKWEPQDDRIIQRWRPRNVRGAGKNNRRILL